LLSAVAAAVVNIDATQVCWLVTDKTKVATATQSVEIEHDGTVVYDQSESQGGSGNHVGSDGSSGSEGGSSGNYGSSGSNGRSGSHVVVGGNGRAQAWMNGRSGGMPYGVTIETYSLGSHNTLGSEGAKSNAWSSSSTKITDSMDGHSTPTYQTPWFQPYSRYGNSSWTHSSSPTAKPSSATPYSSKTRSSAPPSSSGYCINSPTNRQCWGKYNIETNYYTTTPDTGNTVEVKSCLKIR